MKTDTHPEYVEAHVRCTCGNEFTTRSTKPELHVEICSNCHPFYTGRQKLVDTGGRVERFRRRAAKRQGYLPPKRPPKLRRGGAVSCSPCAAPLQHFSCRSWPSRARSSVRPHRRRRWPSRKQPRRA